MSAIFNFQSLLTVVLLLICTCAFLRAIAPSLLDRHKTGFAMTKSCTNYDLVSSFCSAADVNYRVLGTFWKCARIGERKSPYVAVCCVAMAFSILFLT